jgi:hypothetical protein
MMLARPVLLQVRRCWRAPSRFSHRTFSFRNASPPTLLCAGRRQFLYGAALVASSHSPTRFRATRARLTQLARPALLWCCCCSSAQRSRYVHQQAARTLVGRSPNSQAASSSALIEKTSGAAHGGSCGRCLPCAAAPGSRTASTLVWPLQRTEIHLFVLHSQSLSDRSPVVFFVCGSLGASMRSGALLLPTAVDKGI